jgi:hypothetical protein
MKTRGFNLWECWGAGGKEGGREGGSEAEGSCLQLSRRLSCNICSLLAHPHTIPPLFASALWLIQPSELTSRSQTATSTTTNSPHHESNVEYRKREKTHISIQATETAEQSDTCHVLSFSSFRTSIKKKFYAAPQKGVFQHQSAENMRITYN